MSRETVLGLAGEFTAPDALVAAVRAARGAGYSRLEAFTPFPLPELTALLEMEDWAIGWGTLVGAVLGLVFGLWLGWYVNAVVYPLNVGGRPVAAWPAFVVPAFETAVLFGAIGALVTLLARCGLPRLHHPVFEIPGFLRASDDRFFLLVEAADAQYHPRLTRQLLERSGAVAVTEVGQRWHA